MKDENELVLLLKSNPNDYNRALGYIYDSSHFRDPILRFLKSKGLSVIDAEALWTDIVVKFAFLVKSGKYNQQGRMLGYIKNLSNYMLLNTFRKNKQNFTVELDSSIADNKYIEENTMYHSELKEMLNHELSLIGEICKKTLFFWAQGYSMKEIMQKLSFVSLESTRKRKHTCLKKLLKHVDNNENLHNTLKDYYYAISQKA